jgi:hypothetical protein
MWTIRRDVPISATHRGIASVPNSARDKLKDSAHAKAVVAEMQDAMTKLAERGGLAKAKRRRRQRGESARDYFRRPIVI